MPNITKYILRVASLAVGFTTIFTVVSMMIGGFVATDRFSAVIEDNNQTSAYVYLIDLRRGLTLRVYPQLDQRTITNIQPSWDEPSHVYVWQRRMGAEAGDATILYRMNVLTGDMEALIDTRQHAIKAAVFASESPLISPNGRYLAFGSYALGNIYVLDSQTKTLQQVLDLSQRRYSSNGQDVVRGFASPQWSPDSQYLTFGTGDALYLLKPDKNAPLEIRRPGRGLVVPRWWSKDAKTLWFTEYSVNAGRENPPVKFELNTHHVETVVVPDETAVQISLQCDGRWMTYLVPHELNARTGRPSGNPPLFSGYIRNMKTGDVIALDDVLSPEAAPVEYIWMRNCDAGGGEDGRPLALIASRMGGLPEKAPQLFPALYLLDLESLRLTQVTSMGNLLTWEDGEQTLVYSVYEKDNLQTLYRRPFQVDSQAVRIGIYAGENRITALSGDYTQVLVVEGNQQGILRGRLMRADLQTGLQTYLTPPGENFMFPQRILWD